MNSKYIWDPSVVGKDILPLISQWLDPEDVKNLSPSYAEAIEKIESDPITYKRRIENLYNGGELIGDDDPNRGYDVNWEEVYHMVHKKGDWQYLLFMAQDDDVEYVKLSLDMGADPSIPNTNADIEKYPLEEYALGKAVKYGNVDIVKLLLEDERSNPTLDYIIEAIKKEYIEILKLLLANGRVDPGETDNQAIFTACSLGYREVTIILLNDDRVDPSDTREDIFGYLIVENHSISQPEKIRYGRNPKLRVSSEDERLAILEILLADARVDPSIDDGSALIYALDVKYFKIFNRLLADKRINPNLLGSELLDSAINSGNVEIVKTLIIEYNMDPSDPDIIITAMKSKNLDIFITLLEDRRVNLININNEIVENLHRTSVEIAKVILSNPNIDPSFGDNIALIGAVKNNNVEIIKLLLTDERIDPSYPNNELIILAAMNPQNGTIFDMLMKDNRVDPSARNNLALTKAIVTHGYNPNVLKLVEDPRVMNKLKELKDINWSHITRVRNKGYDFLADILSARRSEMLKHKNVVVFPRDKESITKTFNNKDQDAQEIILQDPNIDPSIHDNLVLRLAATNGNYRIIKFLLKDDRVLDKLRSNIDSYRDIMKYIQLAAKTMGIVI